MNAPGFSAQASLYKSTATYGSLGNYIHGDPVSPQLPLGSILGTAFCYGGCFWRYLECI